MPIEPMASRPRPVNTMARVLSNRPVMPGGAILRLALAAAVPPFPAPHAGQFVHLRLGDFPLLRRPFSVLGFVPAAAGGATLEIMYAVVGRGTERIAALVPGDRVEILGPLGNAYVLGAAGSLILVAGGRGAVPLFRLLESGAARGREVVFLFGARSRDYLWELERLAGIEHRLATDDGSAGEKGTVIDLLRAELARRPRGSGAGPVRVFACGPEIMLRRVAETASEFGAAAQVALESPMGCAIGICRGCVIPRRLTAAGMWARDGNARYATVCKEGPVFLGEEVDWEALERALDPAGAAAP
jgi:dihydroorotate dehydrogenase electron transfer subunit